MSAGGTLTCAECGVEMTTADAEMAVATDAGPVHRECFEGPVPPGSTGSEIISVAEEEQARLDHHDVPLSEEAREGMAAEEYRRREGLDESLEPMDCPECHAEAAIRGGRGFLCRGRSMLP